jgi:hypothetical protein
MDAAQESPGTNPGASLIGVSVGPYSRLSWRPRHFISLRLALASGAPSSQIRQEVFPEQFVRRRPGSRHPSQNFIARPCGITWVIGVCSTYPMNADQSLLAHEAEPNNAGIRGNRWGDVTRRRRWAATWVRPGHRCAVMTASTPKWLSPVLRMRERRRARGGSSYFFAATSATHSRRWLSR